MELRKVKPEDLQQITALFQNTVLKVNSRDYSPAQVKAWSHGAHNTEGWLTRMREQYFVIAEEAQCIAGFASLAPDGYLDLLFVHHAHQGKGVATALIGNLFSYAHMKRIPLLSADVSITAKTFFQRNGFEVVHEQSIEIEGVTLINYRMQKNMA